jgi:hypothetical protein
MTHAKKFQIKPANAMIWNLNELLDFLLANQGQHIVIENGTEGCCANAIGLYTWLDKFKFASVTIETSNILEKHPRYIIKYQLPWKFLQVFRAIDSSLHTWNTKSIFGTLYARPIWHRLGLTAYLLSHHADKSAVGFLADPQNINERDLSEIKELYYHHPERLQNYTNIMNQLPLKHQGVAEYFRHHAELGPVDGPIQAAEHVYQNFLIDIVSESFTTGDSFFITEKTVRSMMLKKPMIVMGSRNYLDYLHQMGFQTFNDFWDENYDGFCDADRYKKILELIDQLSGLSLGKLQKIYHGMQSVLDHNYDLLMSRQFRTKITYIE